RSSRAAGSRSAGGCAGWPAWTRRGCRDARACPPRPTSSWTARSPPRPPASPCTGHCSAAPWPRAPSPSPCRGPPEARWFRRFAYVARIECRRRRTTPGPRIAIACACGSSSLKRMIGKSAARALLGGGGAGEEDGHADADEQVRQETPVAVVDAEVAVEVEPGGVVGEHVVADVEVERGELREVEVEAAAALHPGVEAGVVRPVVARIVEDALRGVGVGAVPVADRVLVAAGEVVLGLREAEAAGEVDVEMREDLAEQRQLAGPRRQRRPDAAVEGHGV